MSTRAAVFDLDGTLLPGVSAERLFIRYLIRRGSVGARQLLRSAVTASTLPVRGRTAALRRNKGYLSGLEVDRVRRQARDFIGDVLDRRFCPVLSRHVAELRDGGHIVCLLSGTLDVLAEMVAEHLGMADGIGTGLEISGGRYTGRIAGTHYFADGKLQGVDTLMRRHDFDLGRSSAFADRATDVHFLARFGHPMAVNPDRVLRLEAQRRGWPVFESGQRALPPRETRTGP